MITGSTSLRELAFIVCTALDRAGTTAILSGGGAATVLSEGEYQSRDLDFIFSFWSSLGSPSVGPLLDLGFYQVGSSYKHPDTKFSVDFPAGPLAIGSEVIETWQTLSDGNLVLHILSPTNCVRDRLAWFMFANDYSALGQAISVAQRHEIDLDLIERWSLREGESAKFQIFKNRLN